MFAEESAKVLIFRGWSLKGSFFLTLGTKVLTFSGQSLKSSFACTRKCLLSVVGPPRVVSTFTCTIGAKVLTAISCYLKISFMVHLHMWVPECLHSLVSPSRVVSPAHVGAKVLMFIHWPLKGSFVCTSRH